MGSIAKNMIFFDQENSMAQGQAYGGYRDNNKLK
jgi:hypothetical protein